MFGKGAPRCPRCHDNVYPAEEVLAAGRSWHQQCFSCKNCKKQLGSQTQSEKDGELYCNNCYAKLFGPKGFGIGSHTTMTGIVANSSSSAPSSASSAPSSSSSSSFCSSCGAKDQTAKFCSSCGAIRSGATPSTSDRPTPSAASSFKPIVSASTSASVPKFGAPVSDKCGRCSKTVYHAEKVNGAGQVWHEECFTCEVCKKRLDSTTLQDKDGKIYCKTDHAKLFGPKGYGFAGGSATVLSYTK